MPFPYSDSTGQLISGRRAQASFIRAANTTQYAAGDVVNGDGVLVPIALPVNQPGGVISSVRLTKSGEVLTLSTFRVHFFSASFATDADNAIFTKLHANRASYLGFVDLPIMVNDGTGSGAAFTKDDDLRIPFPGETVYAVIVAVGAYTPASAEVFNLGIGIE